MIPQSSDTRAQCEVIGNAGMGCTLSVRRRVPHVNSRPVACTPVSSGYLSGNAAGNSAHESRFAQH